jgi:DNA-binding NarL/FixJ family response regulator
MRLLLIVSRREVFVGAWQAAWQRSGAAGGVRVAGEADPAAGAVGIEEVRLVALDLSIFPSQRTGHVRRWKAAFQSLPLILGGDEFTPERELAALGLGMSAVCDQRMAEEGLSRVISVVLGGGVWISGAAMPQLMDRLAHAAVAGNAAPAESKGGSGQTPSALSLLTERQREVAELLAQGESNKIIGRKLNIANRTVKAHLSAIFEKLMVTDRVQLAVLLNRQEPNTDRPDGDSRPGGRSRGR